MRALQGYSVLLFLLVAGGSLAQNYPTKVVRIVTAPASSSSDFVARIVSADLTASLGQPVVVENRPGGIPLFTYGAKAPPDGYTLMVSGGVWVPALMDTVPYDPIKDFAPVTSLTRTPNILVVHPSLPVKTVKELIAMAKSMPDKLNYSTGATGASSHLAGEFFKAYAGVDVVRIAYNNQALNVADTVSGQIHMAFGLGAQWSAMVKAGKLRALATTGSTRSALLPNLPAMNEILPGFIVEQLQAMYAPAKTPDAIVRRLNQESIRALEKPQARERLLTNGLEPSGSTPEQLTEYAKGEMARVGKMIKDLGSKFDRSGS